MMRLIRALQDIKASAYPLELAEGCRTPRLNSVLELLLNVDRGFGENKKGRTLKNLEFSPLVEPGRVELPSKQATY